jgi:mRNA interferase RelE/StbE
LISMSSESPKTYKLRLSNRASKYLSHLDKTTTSRILDKLEHLKNDPYHSVGTKKLSGKLTGLFRLRIGNYRAVYQINDDYFIVTILVIGPRGNIYDHLS